MLCVLSVRLNVASLDRMPQARALPPPAVARLLFCVSILNGEHRESVLAFVWHQAQVDPEGLRGWLEELASRSLPEALHHVRARALRLLLDSPVANTSLTETASRSGEPSRALEALR